LGWVFSVNPDDANFGLAIKWQGISVISYDQNSQKILEDFYE